MSTTYFLFFFTCKNKNAYSFGSALKWRFISKTALPVVLFVFIVLFWFADFCRRILIQYIQVIQFLLRCGAQSAEKNILCILFNRKLSFKKSCWLWAVFVSGLLFITGELETRNNNNGVFFGCTGMLGVVDHISITTKWNMLVLLQIQGGLRRGFTSPKTIKTSFKNETTYSSQHKCKINYILLLLLLY